MSPDVEPACPTSTTAAYRPTSTDSPVADHHNLCSDCFPSGEIGDDVGELCYSWHGEHVHRTARDADETLTGEHTAEMPETKLATRLADPEVTSLDDLRDGGDA